MFDKLKEFFSSPYAAPLAVPLKNIAAITYMPVRDFAEAVRESFKEDGDGTVWPARLAREIESSYGFGASAIGFFGAALGIVGGGVVGAAFAESSLAALGTASQIGAGIALAIGGAGIGAVAGPFILAAAIGAAALIAGVAVGAVPGFISGVYKAVKHALSEKEPAASPVKAWKPEAEPDPEYKKYPDAPKPTAADLMESLSKLPPEERAKFEARLKSTFEKTAPKETPEPEKLPLPEFTKGGGFEKLGKLGAG